LQCEDDLPEIDEAAERGHDAERDAEQFFHVSFFRSEMRGRAAAGPGFHEK
jgi:hypothetical protein